MAGRLRDSGLSTTHLARFNDDVPVTAEVGNKTYHPLLWQAVDSAEMRSFERQLAGAFHPKMMVQEEAGCGVLAQILLLSPRLVSIGWRQMKAAAAAVSDEESAVNLGWAFPYGAVLELARAQRRSGAAARR